MQNKPRYSRISDILDLAIFMSSKFNGITIDEIVKRYSVSRRTAMRMRDSLINIFPQIDEIKTNDTQKHWGFKNYTISQLINFNPKEIATIDQIFRQIDNLEIKKELTKIIEKMKSLNKKDFKIIEKNIEYYLQTEGYAIRQVPQYKIDIEIMENIRNAIQNSKIITGIYHNKKRTIEPLGIIYCTKTYLIAREKAKGKDIYTYLVHKFQDLNLTNKTFDKGDFNLEEYTNQSFGIYHGEIHDVKLSFVPELAEEASQFNFHPTQKGNFEKDGSYTLTFKASGNKEIFWHIFKWGTGCKILAPLSLQKKYKKYLEENLKNY